MKIPVIGVELKRSNAKQRKDLTDAVEAADESTLTAAIETKKAELSQVDAYIVKAQLRRKKVTAELTALEGMLKARQVGNGGDEEEVKEAE